MAFCRDSWSDVRCRSGCRTPKSTEAGWSSSGADEGLVLPDVEASWLPRKRGI
jgi:hypothetical protein